MPRNSDPSEIEIGYGRAGQNSVTASSLTVTITVGGGGQQQGTPLVLEEPPDLSGTTAQLLFDGLNTVAPDPRPNRIGQTLNVENDGTISTSPTPSTPGRYPDGNVGGQGGVTIFGVSTVNLSGIVYPADRGVLAVSLNGTLVNAINLRPIFVEGEPGVLPSSADRGRSSGQLDYAAGSDPLGQFESVPEGFDLTDRLPGLPDYTRANFTFLAAGPDPVYDPLEYEHTPYQLARYSVDITLTPGVIGDLVVHHFKTYEDAFAYTQAQAYEALSEVALHNAVYYDDSALDISIGGTYAYSVAPNDPAAAATATPRFLSGVEYYGPDDPFTVQFSVANLFNESFYENPVFLHWLGDDGGGPDSEFNWSDLTITPTPVTTASTADYQNVLFEPGNDPAVPLSMIVESGPQLIARDPVNAGDTASFSGDRPLIHCSDYSTVPARVENFENEIGRYVDPDDIETGDPPILPNGSGTTWDSEASIDNTNALQVRGLPDALAVPTYKTIGGMLSWPSVNYSVGYVPSTARFGGGAASQFDYSAPTTPGGERTFVRAFDLEGPKTLFRLRIVGRPPSGDMWNMVVQSVANPRRGFDIEWMSNADLEYRTTLNLDTTLGGGLLSYEDVDTFQVILTCQIPEPPALISGYYPLALRLVIEEGSTAETMDLFQIELLDVA